MGTTQKRTRKDLIANIERITKDGNRWGDIALGEIIGLRADWQELARYRCQGYRVKWDTKRPLSDVLTAFVSVPLPWGEAANMARSWLKQGYTDVRIVSVWVKVK